MIEHRTAQLALYSVLFTKSERRKHAQEKVESQSLSLPALLDALPDLEALEVGEAEGLIDDEDAAGGVPLTLEIRGGAPGPMDIS